MAALAYVIDRFVTNFLDATAEDTGWSARQPRLRMHRQLPSSPQPTVSIVDPNILNITKMKEQLEKQGMKVDHHVLNTRPGVTYSVRSCSNSGITLLATLDGVEQTISFVPFIIALYKSVQLKDEPQKFAHNHTHFHFPGFEHGIRGDYALQYCIQNLVLGNSFDAEKDGWHCSCSTKSFSRVRFYMNHLKDHHSNLPFNEIARAFGLPDVIDVAPALPAIGGIAFPSACAVKQREEQPRVGDMRLEEDGDSRKLVEIKADGQREHISLLPWINEIVEASVFDARSKTFVSMATLSEEALRGNKSDFVKIVISKKGQKKKVESVALDQLTAYATAFLRRFKAPQSSAVCGLRSCFHQTCKQLMTTWEVINHIREKHPLSCDELVRIARVYNLPDVFSTPLKPTASEILKRAESSSSAATTAKQIRIESTEKTTVQSPTSLSITSSAVDSSSNKEQADSVSQECIEKNPDQSSSSRSTSDVFMGYDEKAKVTDIDKFCDQL